MYIELCILGKASSNGSMNSKLSAIAEILCETANIIRWPTKASFPTLRIKC